MARPVRDIASVAVLLLLAGCSEIFGTRASIDVSVVAYVEADSIVFFVIQNDSPEAVFLDISPCVSWLQHHEDGDWHYPVRKYRCIDVLVLERIEPGDRYTSDKWDTDEWEPGEYRYALPLTHTEDVGLLPDQARISNTFQIDG